MQRHVDIFRHKVIMGIHNKPRKTMDMSGMDPEKSFLEGSENPIDDDDIEIN